MPRQQEVPEFVCNGETLSPLTRRLLHDDQRAPLSASVQAKNQPVAVSRDSVLFEIGEMSHDKLDLDGRCQLGIAQSRCGYTLFPR